MLFLHSDVVDNKIGEATITVRLCVVEGNWKKTFLVHERFIRDYYFLSVHYCWVLFELLSCFVHRVLFL